MSEILANWRAGAGLEGVLAIDGHTHVGEWPHGANFADVDEMVRVVPDVLDAACVDAACVMSGGYMWAGTDYTLGNDVLIALVRRLGERLIPFAHVNPCDHLPDILGELDRVHAAGMRCIKLINAYQGYPGDGPNLMAVYAFAAERGMLILNHSWTGQEITKIASRFAEMDFIFGHYGHWQDEILRTCPNVYANIWSLGSLGFLERGIGAVGPEKFLFGSDAFMNPISVGIGLVVYADIPDDHKRMILGSTMARLLDKAGALPEALRNRYEH